MKHTLLYFTAIVGILSLLLPAQGAIIAQSGAPVQESGSTIEWTHLSSANGELPPPSNATQQTAALILGGQGRPG